MAPNISNLGADLVAPTHNPPFSFTTFGVVPQSGLVPPTTKTPSAEQTDAFIKALDTLDVVIINSMVAFDQVIVQSAHRDALLEFAKRKGYITVHATTDSRSAWSSGDSINGARYDSHLKSDRKGTLRPDSVYESEPAWKFLNQGIFNDALEASFVEEWLFFTKDGATIRSQENLKPTTKLIESSLVGGLQVVNAMGDHPYSWYRTHTLGGRFFYTGVGHRPNLWNTNAQAPLFFRRQLYNAILWTAKYDSLSSVSIKNTKSQGLVSDFARVSIFPSMLAVTMIPHGKHTVELLALDGKQVDKQKGSGNERTYKFTGLRSGIYTLVTSSRHSRSSRLVTIP